MEGEKIKRRTASPISGFNLFQESVRKTGVGGLSWEDTVGLKDETLLITQSTFCSTPVVLRREHIAHTRKKKKRQLRSFSQATPLGALAFKNEISRHIANRDLSPCCKQGTVPSCLSGLAAALSGRAFPNLVHVQIEADTIKTVRAVSY